MTENRSDPRYAVAVTAEVTAGGQVHEGLTRNLSAGGVNVLLPEELPEGALVQVTLLLTQDGVEDANTEPLDLASNVVWSAPTEAEGFMVGLRFATLSPKQQAHIAGFLERQGG